MYSVCIGTTEISMEVEKFAGNIIKKKKKTKKNH